MFDCLPVLVLNSDRGTLLQVQRLTGMTGPYITGWQTGQFLIKNLIQRTTESSSKLGAD